MRIWVLVACALFPQGCVGSAEDAEEMGAPPVPTSEAQVLPVTLEAARAQIDSLIGDATATAQSQCRLSALGVRPCGGPRSWLAYSLALTDSAALAGLVAVYERLDRERNEREGLMSTCELMEPPALAFENGRCVTR